MIINNRNRVMRLFIMRKKKYYLLYIFIYFYIFTIDIRELKFLR